MAQTLLMPLLRCAPGRWACLPACLSAPVACPSLAALERGESRRSCRRDCPARGRRARRRLAPRAPNPKQLPSCLRSVTPQYDTVLYSERGGLAGCGGPRGCCAVIVRGGARDAADAGKRHRGLGDNGPAPDRNDGGRQQACGGGREARGGVWARREQHACAPGRQSEPGRAGRAESDLYQPVCDTTAAPAICQPAARLRSFA